MELVEYLRRPRLDRNLRLRVPKSSVWVWFAPLYTLLMTLGIVEFIYWIALPAIELLRAMGEAMGP